MRITLNGESHELEEPCTIANLVVQHPPQHHAYAVEVNAQLVPRAEHSEHDLKDGDAIEIVTLVGGG